MKLAESIKIKRVETSTPSFKNSIIKNIMSTVTITAAEVNKLRQETGAGIMDCKKALTETNGDFEAAID